MLSKQQIGKMFSLVGFVAAILVGCQFLNQDQRTPTTPVVRDAPLFNVL